MDREMSFLDRIGSVLEEADESNIFSVLSHLPQSIEKYRQVDVIVQIRGTNHPTDRIPLGAVVHADGQVTSHVILAKKSRRNLSTTPGAWETCTVESKAFALRAHHVELSLTM